MPHWLSMHKPTEEHCVRGLDSLTHVILAGVLHQSQDRCTYLPLSSPAPVLPNMLPKSVLQKFDLYAPKFQPRKYITCMRLSLQLN